MRRPASTNTTALGRTPVLDERTGCRCTPEAERNYQLRVMGREVMVAVTDGRLDGSAALAGAFGTWERILCQLDG